MTDIVPISLEQADLRRAVRQIADKYGHRYFVECATSPKEPTELYRELGAGGFLGVHPAEEYGGGGADLSELTAVIEPDVAAVVPQHRFLGGRREQPVPGHTNTLSTTTDNSGEVKPRSLPRPKAGAPTPRSS